MIRVLVRLLIVYAISPPRKERRMNNTIWTVVGVLAIVALLIFIIPHFH